MASNISLSIWREHSLNSPHKWSVAIHAFHCKAVEVGEYAGGCMALQLLYWFWGGQLSRLLF
jgi:hypothetical protein